MRSFDIPARQARDSSDNDGDPGVTDCHLFLAISLSVSLSPVDPERESWRARPTFASALSLISNSNTGNRKTVKA